MNGHSQLSVAHTNVIFILFLKEKSRLKIVGIRDKTASFLALNVLSMNFLISINLLTSTSQLINKKLAYNLIFYTLLSLDPQSITNNSGES